MGVVLIPLLVIINILVLYFIIKYAVKSAIREIKEEDKKLKDIDI